MPMREIKKIIDKAKRAIDTQRTIGAPYLGGAGACLQEKKSAYSVVHSRVDFVFNY